MLLFGLTPCFVFVKLYMFMIPAVSLEALVFVAIFLLDMSVKQNAKARDDDNTDLAMAEEKGDD